MYLYRHFRWWGNACVCLGSKLGQPRNRQGWDAAARTVAKGGRLRLTAGAFIGQPRLCAVRFLPILKEMFLADIWFVVVSAFGSSL